MSMTTTTSLAVNTLTDTGVSVTITPQSSSSKFLLIFNTAVGSGTASTSAGFNFVRNGTAVGIGTASSTVNFSGMCGVFNTSHDTPMAMQYLDSPATASAITYKVQWSAQNAITMYLNRSAASFSVDTNPYSGGYVTTLTVLEISGS